MPFFCVEGAGKKKVNQKHCRCVGRLTKLLVRRNEGQKVGGRRSACNTFPKVAHADSACYGVLGTNQLSVGAGGDSSLLSEVAVRGISTPAVVKLASHLPLTATRVKSRLRESARKKHNSGSRPTRLESQTRTRETVL